MVIIVYYLASRVLSLEERVHKYILHAVKDRGLTFKNLREPTRFDGVSPFYESSIRYRTTETEFLGMQGERLFTKILDIEKEGTLFRYWVRVETIAFKPVNIEWKELKIITADNRHEYK